MQKISLCLPRQAIARSCFEGVPGSNKEVEKDVHVFRQDSEPDYKRVLCIAARTVPLNFPGKPNRNVGQRCLGPYQPTVHHVS